MDTALVKRSWDLYLKNIGIALGATIVAGIIGGITIGILAGPMIAGLVVLYLNMVRGQKAEFNQLFDNLFDKFLPKFLVVLIVAIATVLLSFAQNIPLFGGIIFQTITMILSAITILAIAGVVEKNLDFIPALQFGVGYLAGRPAILLLFGGYGLAMGVLNLLFSFSWVLMGLFGTLIGLFTLFIAPMFGLALMISYNEDGAESKMDMKLLQIVGIGLAAVIVVGLVFMIVRGPVRQVGGIFGGRARSGFTRSGDPNFTLSGKDEKGNKVSLGFGSSIPKSFPKDVPIYKGAEVFSSSENREEGSVTVMATVDDKADSIRQYYYSELGRRGWEINQESSGIFGSIIAVKSDRQAVIVIMGDDDEDTSLSITVGKVSE